MPEQNFKTSFIPSKPIQPIKKGGNLGGGSGFGSIINIIAIVIFLSTIVVSVGVYVYKISLNNVIEKQNEEFIAIRALLDSPVIKDADRLNTKINNIKLILENHIAPSEILELLQSTTRQTLKFDTLTYKRESPTGASIVIAGQAKGFETIVLQSDSYSKTRLLKDVLFTGLQPGNDGVGVRFNLSAIVDNDLILYSKMLAKQQN
ncbi:MAG TPA: hypothetical protein PKA60_00840 [Candidatus Paceibacterota bacterium]|mgnify:CR=1 FL=1|nr:hypothetical protein [Candidatus Paceibacterota bacterium]